MVVKQYDTVLLKDGRQAAIVEALDNRFFIVDVGDNPKNWETIDITMDEIEKILYSSD